jgi:hypothetical protein
MSLERKNTIIEFYEQLNDEKKKKEEEIPS